MKFNFKKITPIVAGALLLGSTLGMAMAADLSSYPTPFVSSGASDVAVVYGADANTIDMASATLFTADLGRLVTAGTSTGVSGESVKIETSSSKLNIGQNLTNARSTSIEASDLPTLLAKKTYQSKDGVSYDYEQKLSFNQGLKYTYFKDIDYNSNIPSLGIKITANSELMNYTLSFTKTVESDVSSDRLEDIQDSDIVMLGKTYRILNAYNGTTTSLYLELMGGAVVDSLTESANKSYTMDGKNYDVSISNIASDGAALIINGQTTPKMNAGTTYKLSDGTQVGVRTLWYQTNKVSSVEFSLGAEKLTLYSGGQNVKINDVTVNDLKSFMTVSENGAKKTISQIKLQWMPSDAKFLTKDTSLEFPGLKSIKLTMGDITAPSPETIQVQNNGDYEINLKATTKSGEVTLPILYGNGTNFRNIGTSSVNLSTTSGTSATFTYDRDINNYFVASHESTAAAESYVLKVTNMINESSITYADIQDYNSNTICEKKKNLDTCTIGSVVLTLGGIDNTNRNLTITCDANCRFDRLYTTNGMKIYLPVDSVAVGTGNINLTTTTENETTPFGYNLTFSEKDKNNNLGYGQNITAMLGWTSGKAEVSSVSSTASIESSAKKVEGTDDYVNYVASALGSKYTLTDVTQNSLKIVANNGESYGNVYLAVPTAVVSASGSAVFDVAVPDTEAIPNKNLIVIGGSAVNKVSAQLLGLTYPAYGAAFTDKTGVSQDMAILKLTTNPSYSTKVALLVSGWEGKDTKSAAKALISKSVALSGKSEAVLTTVTEAQTALK
jgi:hypothetical protein